MNKIDIKSGWMDEDFSINWVSITDEKNNEKVTQEFEQNSDAALRQLIDDLKVYYANPRALDKEVVKMTTINLFCTGGKDIKDETWRIYRQALGELKILNEKEKKWERYFPEKKLDRLFARKAIFDAIANDDGIAAVKAVKKFGLPKRLERFEQEELDCLLMWLCQDKLGNQLNLNIVHIVKLIDFGANINFKDEDGRTPFDYYSGNLLGILSNLDKEFLEDKFSELWLDIKDKYENLDNNIYYFFINSDKLLKFVEICTDLNFMNDSKVIKLAIAVMHYNRSISGYLNKFIKLIRGKFDHHKCKILLKQIQYEREKDHGIPEKFKTIKDKFSKNGKIKIVQTEQLSDCKIPYQNKIDFVNANEHFEEETLSLLIDEGNKLKDEINKLQNEIVGSLKNNAKSSISYHHLSKFCKYIEKSTKQLKRLQVKDELEDFNERYNGILRKVRNEKKYFNINDKENQKPSSDFIDMLRNHEIPFFERIEILKYFCKLKTDVSLKEILTIIDLLESDRNILEYEIKDFQNKKKIILGMENLKIRTGILSNILSRLEKSKQVLRSARAKFQIEKLEKKIKVDNLRFS